jgi:hypothetical protein
MSSIIDALKKSDAKRPRKNHGLNIRMDIKEQTKSKKRWGFYLILVLLLLVLTAVYFQKPDFVWQHTGSSQQPALVSDNPEKTMPAQKKNKKLSKPKPKEVQTVAKKQSNQSVGKKKPDQVNTSESRKTQPVTVSNEESNKPVIKTDTADTSNSENNSTEVLAQQEIDSQLAATPMKNKQAINATPEDKQPEEQSNTHLPQLFELPYSVRKDLPKLNLSVHVYDPVVENRMAIINGVPIHVGDTFEELISIQDITQSGVILRVQGRDFIVLK